MLLVSSGGKLQSQHGPTESCPESGGKASVFTIFQEWIPFLGMLGYCYQSFTSKIVQEIPSATSVGCVAAFGVLDEAWQLQAILHPQLLKTFIR
jgi:hypothetical protein